MPRWFWLLPVAAMAVWWPIGAYWASDDFLAVLYSQHLSDAASDLVGRQYGATDIWTFYRPLITLSFWFDQKFAGVWPPFGHCSNVVAHGLSTLLVALIWRRFLGNGAAFGAAILWAMMPGHVGSIAWAVGRVDSHTTVWCLLAVLLCLRANEQGAAGTGGARWPAVVATALALMSKELAFVVPPLCTWLSLMQASGDAPAIRFGQRVRAALHATWPIWLLFALYLPFRLLVLGKFGGYDASSLPADYDFIDLLSDLQAKALGLGRIVIDELIPLRWIGAPADSPQLAAWMFLPAAAMPVIIALLVSAVRRPRLTAGALVAFLVAMVPMVAFWTEHSPHNLRYYYLPTIALAGLLASGGRWLVIAIVLAWLCPTVSVRIAQYAADGQSREMHVALLQKAPEVAAGPMFVAGMPHGNAVATAVQLHFGIDRMLQPPFYAPGVPLFALRPLAQQPGAFRLTPPNQPPFALPEGSTWWFREPSLLEPALPPKALPELTIAGDTDGVLDIGSDRLLQLFALYTDLTPRQTESFGLTTPGVNGPFFRITVFTANGYLCSICTSHGKPGGRDGRIDIGRLLVQDPDETHKYDVARLMVGNLFLSEALKITTTIDLLPEFPTLIEAGSFDMEKLTFTPSHRARRLVHLRFDRSYPEWVRRAQGR